MLPSEDSYGLSKRLRFLVAEIQNRKPGCVLDVGCGTGANLTLPLARRFPEIRFVGVDSDKNSINRARQSHQLQNVEFRVYPDEFAFIQKFDVVVASEVLEHTEEPDAFLATLRNSLTPHGALLVTVPNGYGPFELASFVEVVLHLSGLYPWIRRLGRLAKSGKPGQPAETDTLAVSPHVNFFSYGELTRLFSSQGLRLTRFRARTILCGFGFDQLIRGASLLRWNALWADRLPPQLVSDWMFVLEPETSQSGGDYKRGRYARFRRWLNYRRYDNVVPPATR